MNETTNNSRQEMAISPPRLPLDARLAKKYELDQGRWKVLCDTIFPSARSADAIAMALEYCKARGFDIMKKPVHIVPVWSSEKGALVETIWPGIGELRTTAMRTGYFAGISDCIFGPDMTRTFKGKETYYENKKKLTRDIEVEVTFPEWAQVHVYRMVGGERMLFAGPKVYWLETYAKAGSRSLAPNSMWQQRPRGQLEKCAEAAALRRAFPEEAGGDLTAEEMEGQVWAGHGPIIDHDATSSPPTRPKEQEAARVDYFQAGYEARKDGLDSSEAPDHMGADEYKEWMAGWSQADDEAKQKNQAPEPEPEPEKAKAEPEVEKVKDDYVIRKLMNRDTTLEDLDELREGVEAFPNDYKDPKGLLEAIRKRAGELL